MRAQSVNPGEGAIMFRKPCLSYINQQQLFFRRLQFQFMLIKDVEVKGFWGRTKATASFFPDVTIL
jgi:hypothetical protein